MNADEAQTGANDNLGYVSPNISSAEEQERQAEEELDEAALEQKKRETVELDGIPIDEKDIKFKATEIKRKADISYFVNVVEEPEEAPKDDSGKSTAKPASDKKAFDFKKITALINKPKTNQPQQVKTEKIDIVAKAKSILIDGWHKYITIGVVAAIVILIGCMIIIPIIEKNSSSDTGDDTTETKVYDNPFDRLKDTEINDAFSNLDFDTVERIYSEVEAELTSDEDIAKLYLDKAKRILEADESEVERIYAAAEKAYKKSPKDVDIIKELYVIYGYLGNKEKAEEMNDALIELGVDINDDEEDEEDDNKEDDKKDNDEKDDDEKEDSDKEDKKLDSNEQTD